MTDLPACLTASRETAAATASGYAMLLVLLAMLVLGPAGFVLGFGKPVAAAIALVALITALFVACGFYMIQPNQAAAITLFGDYRGSDRAAGLRWVLPWLLRRKISVRINNVTSERLKVNDLRGNPIEIASNVVWRVEDTAQALFDVDDYRGFVNIQIESAVRAIGSRYPYDDFEGHETTLRNGHEVVNRELAEELQERVAVAGIRIDECRLTHLAYAPEIAGAMLRRQQAEAVVAARTKLVEGAVGMVQLALEQLSQKNVVELDDERRAAMVSNLMVVLCGERDTQPVVNAGTLYQ